LGPEVPLKEVVDSFPNLIAQTAGRLKETSAGSDSRALRQLWDKLQSEIIYPDALVSYRAPQFNHFQLLPSLVKLAIWATLGTILAVFLYRIGLRRPSRSLLFLLGAGPLILLGQLALYQEKKSQVFFRQPLVVLKESLLVRQGNSALYPPVLPANFPVGHIFIKIRQTSSWVQVQYAPGCYGWVPAASLIGVVETPEV
jgi:hypothetical protein